MELITLSPYSKLFWNEYIINPENTNYNMVIDQEIFGYLNDITLNSAVKDLTKHYYLMNCVVHESDDLLFWKYSNIQLEIINVSSEKELEDLVKLPFDLRKGPLIRFILYKKGDRKNQFIIVLHHILIDGFSAKELYESLSYYYNSYFVEEKDKNRVKGKYVGWQEINHLSYEYKEKIQLLENVHDTKNFWMGLLKGLPETNSLPYTKNKEYSKYDVSEVRFSIPYKQWNELKRNIKYTRHFLVFKTLWALLVSRQCQQDIVYITYPIAIEGGHDLIYGAQINTAIFPLFLTQDTTFRELYQHTLNYSRAIRINNSLRHTDWPIFNILDLNIIKNTNVSFSQAFLKDINFNFNGCDTKFNHSFNIDIASSDLVLEYQEIEEAFEFRIRYRTALFATQQVEDMAEQYQDLFLNTLRYPDKRLAEHSYLPPTQLLKVLTYSDVSPNSNGLNKKDTLVSLFLKQVENYPNKVALVDQNTEYTYGELLNAAQQLGGYLHEVIRNEYKVRDINNVFIPVCLQREAQSFVTLLAVLLLGAAYVPIDPSATGERFLQIIDDINSPILLTQQELISNLSSKVSNVKLIAIDEGSIKSYSPIGFEFCPKINDIAYILYTSGTTGIPKGVALEHTSVVNLVANIKTIWSQSNRSINCLQFSSFIFDAHVFETFSAICTGSTLYIASELMRKDLSELIFWLDKWKIQFAVIPPALLKLRPKLPSELQYMIFGGEATQKEVFEYYRQQGKTVINAYGPTECSVCVSFHYYNDKLDNSNNIGSAIENLKFYVLDNNLQPLPVGVIGELYISGVGLAREYINKKALTDEYFIKNHLTNDPEYQRLYKTGDLVRWLPQGELEYIGRNDLQVKINGRRIELGEIESALNKIDGIAGCVAIARKDPDRIAVFYVIDSSISEHIRNKIDDKYIYDLLSLSLPYYMLPSSLMEIDAIPLTINGKLDVNALPEPKKVSKSDYHAPQNKLEAELCVLWQDILQMDRIGMRDNFFILGGDSILAISICAKMSKILKIPVPVMKLYQNPTLSDLLKDIHFNLISKLNRHEQYLPELWCVHPAIIGSEAYAYLAAKLDGKINCFGVDNYNLYNSPMLGSLSMLAGHYVDSMLDNRNYLNKQDPIYLLGWSLGGVICLEMTAKLESLGFYNIHAYILDSFYQTNFSFSDEVRNKYLIDLGIKEEAFLQVEKIKQVEELIVTQPLSQRLKTTKVTLFKALYLPDVDINDQDNFLKLIEQSDNGLGAICDDLIVYPLHCNHGEILIKYEDSIIKHLLQDMEGVFGKEDTDIVA